MTDTHSSFHQILQYVFPVDILEFFDITNITETTHPKTEDKTIEITLEEKNAPPVIPNEHRGKTIRSNGFHRPITLQHFPLQDNFCFLKIKRRRWIIEDTGTLTRTLSFLPDSGLKLTTDFAAFLKEADRTRTSGGRTHRETVWDQETGTRVQE